MIPLEVLHKHETTFLQKERVENEGHALELLVGQISLEAGIHEQAWNRYGLSCVKVAATTRQ